jgi:tetratricopeptide (TPR) repeat protein
MNGKNMILCHVCSYERGCRLLEDAPLQNDDDEQKQQHLLLKLLLNRALCYLEIKWPKKSCLVLQDALKINPRCAKALYRMGKAKRMLCGFFDARKFLVRAINCDPNNDIIGSELASIDEQIKREQDNERALYQRMMSNNQNRNRITQQPPMQNLNFTLEDEEYAEIVDQLKEFKMDETQDELPLPSGFDPDAIRVIETLATQLKLVMVPGRLKNQYKVVKNHSSD